MALEGEVMTFSLAFLIHDLARKGKRSRLDSIDLVRMKKSGRFLCLYMRALAVALAFSKDEKTM